MTLKQLKALVTERKWPEGWNIEVRRDAAYGFEVRAHIVVYHGLRVRPSQSDDEVREEIRQMIERVRETPCVTS